MSDHLKQLVLIFVPRRNAEKLKTLLACCLYYSGIAWLLSHRVKPGGYIIMYHSVGGKGVFWDNVVRTDAFRKQIQWLSRHRKIVPVSDIVERLEQRLPIPNTWVALTFDDGYRDNYSSALPVLESMQAHASFYITWNVLSGKQEFFYDRIHESIRKTDRESIAIEFEGRVFKGPTLTDSQKLDLIQSIVLGIRNLSEAQRAQCVMQVEAACENAGSSVRQSYLDEQTLHAFSRSALVKIGSHTLSHPDLATCTDSLLKDELQLSKESLSALTGYAIDGLAYPFGKAVNYNSDVSRCCAELGYNYALTTRYGGVNETSDPYQLCRVGARDSLTRLKVNLLGIGI